MKAVIAPRYGDPDVLTLTDADDPKVGPDSVLVRVRAAGVNPVDWKIVAGHLDPLMHVHFPLIPGWDVAGVVEAVGLDATEFSVGDEVYGYVRKDEVQHGTFAELVAAPVRTLAHRPAALSWEQAAAVPLAGLTAFQALARIGVGQGDTVLVHAAAGGVGSFAVQIAAAQGARVIGTASERNHDFVRSLGGEPVDYGEGLADRVRALAPEGVTAALDLVGGGAAQLSQDLLADRTRVASITDATITRTGGRHVWVRPSSQDLAALGRLADDGRLTAHIGHSLPLERAAEAFELSKDGHVRGKIVLTVGD
ncbi:NADP-dependent oxidoreductase [Actinacidiphila sp. DG2A-62]|uniref:NADP-dependent oxidoreductase n=1 Tax=Actinacidiphila sp. DG2A-62 TaxID=3108821 RepID=UPI002DBD7DDE|nr:NADP-dependent oxidoreductase [Actinacidiphila sp. DG2A-62]MEC3998852.1 NADP-dependent oxidoreductase [Actinacidiphila sp. DG2A-62]